MHALQIIVSGFHDVETGEKIIKVLDNTGFDIRECVEGKWDTLGGYVETHITDVQQLEDENLDNLRKAVYACGADNPGILIEVVAYDRTEV